MTNTRKLAEQIAADLFTSPAGKADRLVLIHEGRDLGGWCEKAVADWIEKRLNETEGRGDRENFRIIERQTIVPVF